MAVEEKEHDTFKNTSYFLPEVQNKKRQTIGINLEK